MNRSVCRNDNSNGTGMQYKCLRRRIPSDSRNVVFIHSHYYEHMYFPQPFLDSLHIANPANYGTGVYKYTETAKMRIEDIWISKDLRKVYLWQLLLVH